MDTARFSIGLKGVAVLTVGFTVLSFCFSFVRCGSEIFCPPALDSVPYVITAEIYDTTNTNMKATWYFGQDVLADCNIADMKYTYSFSPPFQYKNISFQLIKFSNGGVQFNLLIPSFVKDLEKNYSIEWTIDDATTKDTCEVKLGSREDECSTTKPCVNATQCVNLDVGYNCQCINGYQDKNCQRGDRKLYCDYNTYKVVFDQIIDSCATIKFDCYIAGLNKGSDIGLNYTPLNGSSSSGPTVQPNAQGSGVSFQICITFTTPKGVYQIYYDLWSNQARANFTINIIPEVGVSNTVPKFNTPGPGVPYFYSIPETGLSQGSIIAYVRKSGSLSSYEGWKQDIQVYDPDVNQNLGMDSLSLSVTLESSQPAPVIFQKNATDDSFGYFFISGQLRPSTDISYILTVTDGGGSQASARAVFSITDVNEPPVCDLSVISASVDIRAQPNTYILVISCTDSDTNETLRQIYYNIEGQYASYFNMSTKGEIIVSKSLMDLQPGLLAFNVTVRGYSETPDTAYVFYKPVMINLTVPEPKCMLSVISLPSDWGINSSVQLRLECNISSVDKLNVSSWSPLPGFDVQALKESPTVYKVILTMKQYNPGTYTFEVMATLGGAGSLTSVVLQVYHRPYFHQFSTAVTIADTTPVNSTILSITASTDVPNAILLFSIKGGDTQSIFTMSTDGVLKLTSQPQAYVGSTIRLLFEVRDSVSNLTSSAISSVYILDTNEPPVCDQPSSLTVNSSLPPDSTITTILCQDPDKTPQYNVLTYSISCDPTTVHLDIRNSGDIVLVEALPVGVTSVSLLVNVSDVSFSTLLQFNVTIVVIKCPAETRESEIYFPETPVNSMVTVNCPALYLGQVSRNCSLNQTWGTYSFTGCKRDVLTSIENQIKNMKENGSQYTAEAIEEVVKTVSDNLTSSLSNSSTVLSGDIKQMVGILAQVGDIMKMQEDVTLDSTTLKNFATVTDILLDADSKAWEDVHTEGNEEGARLLVAMDSITMASLRDESLADESPIVKQNIAIKRARSLNDIVFPMTEESDYQDYNGWVLHSSNTAFLSKQAFEKSQEPVKYSVILYRNCTDKFKINHKIQSKDLSDKVLNSDVLSFTMNIPLAVLSPPLLLSFSIHQTNYSNPTCGFLDSSARVSGVWSSRGCTLQLNGAVFQCFCNHFTNFALLMSPYGEAVPKDEKILSIISAVGCGISIACLTITIIVYMIVWKYVTNDQSAHNTKLFVDQAILNMNLCVCLILAYIVFLAGVDRADHEIGCKVVAALLHYLFLVVFFIMLSEGIAIFKAVSFVFSAESILCKLIPLSYGVPLIIVAVSLGVTKTEGYGSSSYCWLSTKDGLIWAFVAPVLLVLLINFIILIQVLRIMQRLQNKTAKSVNYRTKSVVRTICVLSPILGITWVFGVLSVNEEAIVFQYLFAIFNSLQGLFIFICYCLYPVQVRDGFRALTHRYRAQSLSSSQKIYSKSQSKNVSESDASAVSHKKGPQRSSDLSSSSDTYSTDLSKKPTSVSSESGGNKARQSNGQSEGQATPTSKSSNGQWREKPQSQQSPNNCKTKVPNSDPHRRSTFQSPDETAMAHLSNMACSPAGVTNPGYQAGLFSTSETNTENGLFATSETNRKNGLFATSESNTKNGLFATSQTNTENGLFATSEINTKSC